MTQSNAPRRSRIQLLALAAVLGLALLGLSQCRAVSDSVTGVDLTAPQSLSARHSCTRRCNSQFKSELVAEQYRFIAAKRACGHSYACKKDEDREHARNLRDIERRKHKCKHSCYNEGAGNSGA